MLEKLWNDIRLVYEGFNFSNKQLIDDLMIISQDNQYLLQYKADYEPVINIRIEKNYSLINMWGLGKFTEGEFKTVDYRIYFYSGDQIYTSENSMIELTYKIIKPFLREVKLKEIGI
jgi:hypothetical protein